MGEHHCDNNFWENIWFCWFAEKVFFCQFCNSQLTLILNNLDVFFISAWRKMERDDPHLFSCLFNEVFWSWIVTRSFLINHENWTGKMTVKHFILLDLFLIYRILPNAWKLSNVNCSLFILNRSIFSINISSGAICIQCHNFH
jgi:hypothetical protein